ncbi:MAG TPA: hypothetical protein VGH81_03265 [Rudaea sp.]|jgi:hypothetical protein
MLLRLFPHPKHQFLSCALLAALAAAAHANPFLDHYTLDTAFNGGVVLDDRFATGIDTPHFAEQLAMLPNGDVVVAGLVPTASQTGNIVGGNIGLVHYTADGGRTGWANPNAAYASYFNIYVTYPNSTSSKYSHIVDVKVVGDYIYVLADYQFSSTDKDVYIVVFGTDGSFVGAYSAFTTTLYEFGAALVPYSYSLIIGGLPRTFLKIIAVANYNSGTIVEANNTSIPHWVVTMKRFAIGAGGLLSVDTTFGHIGNGAIDQPLPLDLCDAGTVNACSGAATHAVGVRTDTGTPTLYLVGNVSITTPQTTNAQTDAFVMAIDGGSGDLVPSFGNGGIYDQPLQIGDPGFGYSNGGPTTGILATRGATQSADLIYFATDDNAFTFCSFYGAAIYKLHAFVGPPFNLTLPDFSWAVGGKATLAATPDCSVSGAAEEALEFNPRSIASDGSRIAVGGYNNNGDPMFTTVRLSDGLLTDFGAHPWLRGDGSKWVGTKTPGGYLDAGFDSVASSGNGTWTVTGTICDATATTACALFGTTRLKSDSIFGNGFD